MPEALSVFERLADAVADAFAGSFGECTECNRGPLPECDSACPVGKTLAWIERERTKYD